MGKIGYELGHSVEGLSKLHWKGVRAAHKTRADHIYLLARLRSAVLLRVWCTRRVGYFRAPVLLHVPFDSDSHAIPDVEECRHVDLLTEEAIAPHVLALRCARVLLLRVGVRTFPRRVRRHLRIALVLLPHNLRSNIQGNSFIHSINSPSL